ncbi:MAG: phosphotransferase family protein [Flavobacteriaceae bacterium]
MSPSKTNSATGAVDASGRVASIASEAELRAWVEEVTRGRVTDWRLMTGGNRYSSWAVHLDTPRGSADLYLRYQKPRPPSVEPYTVRREAEIYAALTPTDLKMPKLVGVHQVYDAILTELKPGRVEYRYIEDAGEKAAIAEEFIAEVARLHHLDLEQLRLSETRPGMTIRQYVERELDIWRAMYEESGRRDALIDFALLWLKQNMPDPGEKPVLVHGDAGPGNFLFDEGHLTALIDWELAHPGDPMEDLAWFSMRCVMEPVPDFAACLRLYEEKAGRPVDRRRLYYHRAMVSARVVIIRHRNVTGLSGNSIVSQGLNRRLLVAALAQANGIDLAPPAPVDAPETPRTDLYDEVLETLKSDVAGRTTDSGIVSATKNAAKVLKFLREADRLGRAVEEAERGDLEALAGVRAADVEQGRAILVDRLADGSIPFADALAFFSRSVARQAQLAALASGSIANRQFPEF